MIKLPFFQVSESRFIGLRDNVKFELELSTFPNNEFQNLHELRMKRLSGDPSLYQRFMSELVNSLNKLMKIY